VLLLPLPASTPAGSNPWGVGHLLIVIVLHGFMQDKRQHPTGINFIFKDDRNPS